MSPRPHLTVATVVEDAGRYLLVEEIDNGRRVFNQPAGHVEAGETLIEAACRETLEETGWTVTPTGVVAVSQYTAPASGTPYCRVTLTARLETQAFAQPPDDAICRIHWLTIEAIRARSDKMRSPLVLHVIERYRQGTLFPLSLLTQPD